MKNLLLFQPVQNLQAARRDLRILIALAAHAVIQRCDDAKVDVHGLKIADAAAGNVQGQRADGRLLREIDRRQAEQLRGRLNADGKDYLECLNPDSLSVLTGCKVERMLAGAEAPAAFQFLRLGYFAVDNKDSAPGHLVFNRAVALKDSFKKA